MTDSTDPAPIDVALLTGGGDKPYAFGLATALMPAGVHLDLIAGDELDLPEFRRTPAVNFLNLRGDQRPNVHALKKVLRVLAYYVRLIRYSFSSRPRVFHILWNNKFEFFDRTLLMLFYKLLGKKIVLTVHNVNAGIRDSNDSWLNRLTLQIQYRVADHIFVHTEKMKSELSEGFGVVRSVTVIPFGINNSVPVTSLAPAEAKQRFGLNGRERTILFFGNIAPYKGLEYLVAAFKLLLSRGGGYRLMIVGKPRGPAAYWSGIEQMLRDIDPARMIQKIEFVPDEDTELYFKAADVLVLPYTEIFQSGVLFLGYSFGLPVIAADVGSMKDDIIEGRTGLVFPKENPEALAAAIESYFASDLYRDPGDRRKDISDFANERHSWETVSRMTVNVYSGLLRNEADSEGLAKATRTREGLQ